MTEQQEQMIDLRYQNADGTQIHDLIDHDACCYLPQGCRGGCTQPGGCNDPAAAGEPARGVVRAPTRPRGRLPTRTTGRDRERSK